MEKSPTLHRELMTRGAVMIMMISDDDGDTLHDNQRGLVW